MSPVPTTSPRPFIPAPGIVQLEAVYTVFAEFCENVYHVQANSGGTPATAAQMDAMLAALETWEGSTGKVNRHAGTSYNIGRARALDVPAGTVREKNPAAPINGTLTGNALPNNVTVAISARTNFGGRSFRGRTYWVGMGASQTDGTNALTPTARSALPAALQSLNTALTAAGFPMGVLSFSNNKSWRTTAVFTPISRFSCEGILDSQRRRLPGRGT